MRKGIVRGGVVQRGMLVVYTRTALSSVHATTSAAAASVRVRIREVAQYRHGHRILQWHIVLANRVRNSPAVLFIAVLLFLKANKSYLSKTKVGANKNARSLLLFF